MALAVVTVMVMVVVVVRVVHTSPPRQVRLGALLAQAGNKVYLATMRACANEVRCAGARNNSHPSSDTALITNGSPNNLRWPSSRCPSS